MNDGARRRGGADPLDTLQLALLIAFSALVLLTASEHWRYTPDSGIYVGTAESLATTGRYHFNGHPNLLYYPGFATLLALPIAIFGVDFRILHGLTAATGVTCLWLARSLFRRSRYGLAGLAVPLALAGAQPLLVNTYAVLSDGLFLALVLAALLAWRSFEERGGPWAGVGCAAFVALASLVRFEGVVLGAALGAALLWRGLRRGASPAQAFARAVALAGVAMLPFVLWTLRNWALHTPDTFNVGNRFFFGLEGLALYAPGLGALEGLESHPVYFGLRLLRSLSLLFTSLTGIHPGAIPGQVALLLAGIGLAAAGARRWFAPASLLERSFVASFLALWVFLQWSAGASIYVVTRYWIPLLPFVLLAWGLGLEAIHARLASRRVAVAVPAVALVLLSLIGWNGARVVQTVRAKAPFYANASRVLAELREYARRELPADARVATTDWGVAPYVLGRESYQILDDPDHRLSLERMDHYEVGYLVVVSGLARFANSAMHLVETAPELFQRLKRIPPDGPGPTAFVYAVRRDAVRSRLAPTRAGDAP